MVLVIQYKLEADMQPRSDKMGDEEQHPPRLWHAHLQKYHARLKEPQNEAVIFPRNLYWRCNHTMQPKADVEIDDHVHVQSRVEKNAWKCNRTM